MTNETLENTVLELRRGVIVLVVLSQLGDEQYGYSLLKLLSERGLEIDQGTLYPLLRRLEAQGLLQSVWKLEEARPRRYYVIPYGPHYIWGATARMLKALSDRVLAP